MSNIHTPSYCGRFAPSPTGPLHFGSLVAALGSYLDARANGGRWLLRMEDLDPPREQAGAADDILRSLETCGLHWDDRVLYQSRRATDYAAALDALQTRDLAYPCSCSRREITDSALTGIEGLVYPGTCRHGLATGRTARAMRARTTPRPITFTDRLQGDRQQNLEQAVGDFVLKRADGYWAYQLAVVVDDAAQGVTHVVRGADLLLSTPRQIHLQNLLSLPHLVYMHLPIAVNAAGEKLSKQTHAAPLDPRQPGLALWSALAFLRQAPPPGLRGAAPAELLAWAVVHWSPAVLAGQRQLPAHQ